MFMTYDLKIVSRKKSETKNLSIKVIGLRMNIIINSLPIFWCAGNKKFLKKCLTSITLKHVKYIMYIKFHTVNINK